MQMISLIRLAVCSVFLTSVTHAAGPAGKLHGGFAPKKTFTFEVQERTSFESNGSTTVISYNIPAGIPNFNIGESVKFIIGKNGQLKGPGFSFPIESGNRDYNHYVTVSTPKNRTPDVAIVTKSTPGTAQQVAIYFYHQKSDGTSYSVSYLMK